MSLLHNGTYADAYGTNVGPTAHSMPLHPLILVGIIRVFGSGPAGSIALSLLASASVALGYALLPALAVVYGFRMLSGFVAGMAGALIPVNFWAQTSGTFDPPFTFLSLVVICYFMGRCWALESFTFGNGARLGILSGVACLLNAAVLQVLVGWLVVGGWRFRKKAASFLGFFAIIGLFVIAALTPWAARNYITFGRAIWTRSNFGLELHVSNNDLATADQERNVRSPAWRPLHPYNGAVERETVRRIGELRYNDAKRKQAVQWITSHPSAFCRLTAQRIVFFWFPPMLRKWQTFLEAALTVMGFLGMVSLVSRRHACAAFLLTLLSTYPVIYYLIHVSPRFRFPIEWVLLLLGSQYVVARLATARRSKPAGVRSSMAGAPGSENA